MLSTAGWLYVALSLGAVAAAAFAAGTLRAAQRRRDALHAAAGSAQALAALERGAVWRSDATHRIRPPAWPLHDSGSVLPADGRPLWDLLETDADGPPLRETVEARAAFGPLRVRRRGAARDDGGWLLRGQPCFDVDGRFDGHLGLLQRAPEAAAAAAGDVDLAAALLDAEPGARLLAIAGPTAGGLHTRHANAAARRRFGGAGDAGLPDWERVLLQLPRALQQAAPTLAPGDSAEQDGWTLRRIGSTALLLAEADGSGADDQASISYTVSHDLRAPIRVVEGFTRILKEDYGRVLDRVGNEHLDRVLAAAARMNQMIDAMLTLARLSTQPLARQPVNLSQIAGWVVDDLRRSAPERIAEVEVEPGLLVHGDPTLLRLVLENLLGNAWKYSQRAPRARIAFVSEPQPAGRRGFVVRDNGAGFDMRSAERLFGLFQRLHSASEFPGTGVGLASVRRIVQRHGGEIWAEAEPGRGAAFHFTLRE